MRLTDKSIIVTGSTTGIGAATARRFVAEGACVLVHGLEQELGETLVAELGDAAAFCQADLTQPDAVEKVRDAALSAFGRIDGIVNNAAYIPRGDLESTDAALFDRTMAINVRAPLLLIRAAVGELKKTRGSVLNIGSVNAYCGEATLLAYSISKGALLTMTRNLADALSSAGVRINQLNPGWVLTENEHSRQLENGNTEDWHAKLPRALAPRGSLIAPDEIAAAAVYWISDESRPCSGTVLEFEQYPIIGRNPVKS